MLYHNFHPSYKKKVLKVSWVSFAVSSLIIQVGGMLSSMPIDIYLINHMFIKYFLYAKTANTP